MKVKIAQLCPTLCDPMDYIVHGILQTRILEWVAFPFPGGFPNPGIKPRSPVLQADSLPAESQGKSKNTRVGSLSILQGIFQTQELNQGLLHCRQILYQLSYQGSFNKVTLTLINNMKMMHILYFKHIPNFSPEILYYEETRVIILFIKKN